MTKDPKASSAVPLRDLVDHAPGLPGIYEMLDGKGECLYVGKAKNLKKRLNSYLQGSRQSSRIKLMLSLAKDLRISVTQTEGEALLLENNLIKSQRPRFNILLRDDKSYPWICLSEGAGSPRLFQYRGRRKKQNRYFGPYPGGASVREAITTLEKVFRIRTCSDSYYKNRSRPCLKFQVMRCSAPCVGKIDRAAYAEDLRQVVLFLEGRDRKLIDQLGDQMAKASNELDYERAGLIRDRIALLSRVQQRQFVEGGQGNVDIIGVAVSGREGCIEMVKIRSGKQLGNRRLFVRQEGELEVGEVIAAFLSQSYELSPSCSEIVVMRAPEERALIEQALSQQAGRRVQIRSRVRSHRQQWLQRAIDNARGALESRRAVRSNHRQRLKSFAELLDLPTLPNRIECFDISHTGGEATMASCVVFDQSGAQKGNYRRYSIRGITPGDDYAAMRQALERRFRRESIENGALPDVLLIDGGKGQLSIADEVLSSLSLTAIILVGVSKGRSRRPGEETLHLAHTSTRIDLQPDSIALHLIQEIRDEAHRFTITGHRHQRQKSRHHSVLESIPGIGGQRRQRLLKTFGGLQEVTRAGVEDIKKIPGFSAQLAQRVYDYLHP
ncbi:MAG: excinuclease ABC subunit C [Acidiferrobacteraceae bacterium]|nr:excinuclease ABC subunit C [Acidiferrobacteraceae bacterium]